MAELLPGFQAGPMEGTGVESPTHHLLLLSIPHSTARCGPPLTLPDSNSTACSDLALGFGVGQNGCGGLGCRQEAPVTGVRSALLGSEIWAAGSLSPL